MFLSGFLQLCKVVLYYAKGDIIFFKGSGNGFWFVRQNGKGADGYARRQDHAIAEAVWSAVSGASFERVLFVSVPQPRADTFPRTAAAGRCVGCAGD